MIDPYHLAADRIAAKLEMLSKELCTNETINTWYEIVSKIKNEQHDGGQSPEKGVMPIDLLRKAARDGW